jgi:peptidoglycan/LPS O-acetylase OafA/YrhL
MGNPVRPSGLSDAAGRNAALTTVLDENAWVIPTQSRPANDRFVLLDALRGVAAVSVLVFHLFNNSPQVSSLHDSLPAWLLWLPDHGRNGVACFFVISGFVIAYSTRHVGTRLRDAGRFAVRRQLRLDPPYYVVVLVVLLLGFLQRAVPGLSAPTYSPSDVVLNLLYVQGITDTPSVLGVAWTLCLEVQFYLVVMLLMIMSGWLARGVGTSGHSRFVQSAAMVLGVLSLAVPFLGWNLDQWFIGTWWMFCCGMVLCWTAVGAVPRSVGRVMLTVIGLWCVLMQLAGRADPWGGMWTAWGTGVAVLLVVELGRTAASAPSLLVYGGTVSYSLYLVHLPVIELVNGAVYKATGDGVLWGIVGVLVGATASFVAAHVLLVFVERPAIRWTHAYRLRRTPARVSG